MTANQTHYAYARGYYDGRQGLDKTQEFKNNDLLQRSYQQGYQQGLRDQHLGKTSFSGYRL